MQKQLQDQQQDEPAGARVSSTDDAMRKYALAERKMRMKAEASAAAWRDEAHAGLEHLASAYGTGRGDAVLGVQCAGWLERKEFCDNLNASGGSAKSLSGSIGAGTMRWKRRWAVLTGGRLSFFRSPGDAGAVATVSLHGAVLRTAALPPPPARHEEHGYSEIERCEGRDYVPERHALAFRLDLSEGCGAKVSLRASSEADWIGWLCSLRRGVSCCNRVAEAEERSGLMLEMRLAAAAVKGGDNASNQPLSDTGDALNGRLLMAAYPMGVQYGGTGVGCSTVAPSDSRLLQLSGARCSSSAPLKLLLSACLNRAVTLQTLELDRCGLSEHGAIGLASILPQMAALRSLSLADNNLTAAGLSSLLTFLLQRQGQAAGVMQQDDDSSSDGDNDADEAVSVLETLKLDRNVNLGPALREDSTLASSFAQLYGLKHLSLSGCRLGLLSDSGRAAVAFFPQTLETLNLAENGFEAADCGGVAPPMKLAPGRLQLGASKPPPPSVPRGAVVQKKEKPPPPAKPPPGYEAGKSPAKAALLTAKLRPGPLTVALLRLAALKSLDLSNNLLKCEGAAAIAACLVRNGSQPVGLATISLCTCGIDTLGVRALAQAMEHQAGGQREVCTLKITGNKTKGALKNGVASSLDELCYSTCACVPADDLELGSTGGSESC